MLILEILEINLDDIYSYYFQIFQSTTNLTIFNFDNHFLRKFLDLKVNFN